MPVAQEGYAQTAIKNIVKGIKKPADVAIWRAFG
jgi:hypothetical protein